MKTNHIKTLFPQVVQRSNDLFLTTSIEVMEAMHQPCELILDASFAYFNPYLTPSNCLPFLAKTLNLDWILSAAVLSGNETMSVASGSGKFRDLLHLAAKIQKCKGTTVGLKHILELFIGSGFILKENQVLKVGIEPTSDNLSSNDTFYPKSFHISIFAPSQYMQLETTLQGLINHFIPAHLSHDLSFYPPKN